MHLLTYTWLMTKHYNTQNDSAFLSAFFFYGISPIQRPHYITSSYTYQFFEKKYILYRFKGEGLLSTLLLTLSIFSTS